MKLVIQLPCYNEALHLPATLACLPRSVAGFDVVEWLVIDDGSRDDTARVALAAGADHVVRHKRNLGLARAFESGLRAALARGADVIVNTDADNQYCADDIPLLTAPILAGQADIVIGERPIASIEHFSPVKKSLQKIGSRVVRWVSNTDVMDAPSGFRAFSREAALKLNVFSDYTYTLETIIQAGQKAIPILSVPIRVNGPTRESRLVKSISSYVKRSIGTMVRIFITYRPLRFFSLLATLFIVPGVALGLRFVYHFLHGHGQGNIQSLILTAMLIMIGFMMLIIGVIADLVAVNRKLLERSVYLLQELQSRPAPKRPSAAAVLENAER